MYREGQWWGGAETDLLDAGSLVPELLKEALDEVALRGCYHNKRRHCCHGLDFDRAKGGGEGAAELGDGAAKHRVTAGYLLDGSA